MALNYSSRNIAYVFSCYPALTEYFYYLEIEGLRRLGWNVHVFALRAGKNGEIGTEEWNLPEGCLHRETYSSSRMWLRALEQCVRRPRALVRLIALFVRRLYFKPIQFAKTLAATAMALSHIPMIEELDIRIIHGAWGHYPSVGAFAMHRMCPNTVFTMALGAYDYDSRFALISDMVESSKKVFVICEERKRQVIEEWPRTKQPVACVYRGAEIVTNHNTGAVRQGIIAIGTLLPSKGFHVLIQALGILETRGIRFRAIIIGGDSPLSPSYGAKLRRQASRLGYDRIVFTGPLPHNQVLEALAASELFVLPSFSEVLPNAVKEALSLKVPVIVTPTLGIGELVQHKRSGLIVPKDDALSLAEALEWAIQNPEEMKQMAIRGYSILAEKFDIEKTSVQRSDYFKQLLT